MVWRSTCGETPLLEEAGFFNSCSSNSEIQTLSDVGSGHCSPITVGQQGGLAAKPSALSRSQARISTTVRAHNGTDRMACALVEHAQTLAFKENFTESEVLTQCHQGLLDGASDFNENEARWVIYRLAELLGWEPPRAVSQVRTY